jgi:hypothetical protein
MRDGELSPGSGGVPLGHKFTAVLLTVAVAGGVYTWFRHTAAQSASSAELAFDSGAARRFDPGLVTGTAPAVTLAQSILTDPVVAGLSKSAYLSSSNIASRIGEFRSRIVLTQPSSKTLRVRFSDADPAKAAETANAIANALAAWTPSLAAASAPVATPQPAPQAASQDAPQAAPRAAPAAPSPARTPVPVHREQAPSGLAAALGELEGQLSSTDRNLDGLGAGRGSSRDQRWSASYAQSEEQRLLKNEVRAAEKKVEDLRTQYADSGAGTKGRLAAIQQAVASILPPGKAVGVDTRQLHHEREQLTHAISVVQQQQQAIQREDDAGSGSKADEPARAPSSAVQESDVSPSAASPAPAANPGSAGSPSSSSASPSASSSASPSSSATPTFPPPVAAGTPGETSLPNPLSVEQFAGPAGPVRWRPAVAAGVLCGLLYLMIAAWRNRAYQAESDYAEEVPRSVPRFITPDVAVPPTDRFEAVESVPVESGPFRRASFSYEPTPEERAESAAREDAPSADPEAEKVVTIADPWDSWTDGMKQTLSQTEIGRRFEGPGTREESAAASSEDERSSHPDRLAG